MSSVTSRNAEASLEPDGSKPPEPYHGIQAPVPQPSSEGLAPRGVPSAPLPQGDCSMC